MAKKSTVGDGQPQNTNLTKTKDIIRECVKGLVAIDEERADLNERAAELRERCKNQGILTPALNFAVKMMKADADDREKFDESYAIARDALGIGMQAGLFDMIKTDDDQPGAPEPKAKAKAAAKPKHDRTPAPPADDSDLAGDDTPPLHGQGSDENFDDSSALH